MSPGSAVDVQGGSFSTIIACINSGKLLFRCQDSTLYAHNCPFLNFKSE